MNSGQFDFNQNNENSPSQGIIHNSNEDYVESSELLLEQKKSNETDLRLIEYQNCLMGYHYRDTNVPAMYFRMIQTFSILLTVILGIHLFAELSAMLYLVLTISLGLIGVIVMVTMLVDIQSSLSAKVALRERAMSLEKEIAPKILSYWKLINTRRKFSEEAIIKKINKSGNFKRHRHFVVLSMRALILMWVIFCWLIIVFK